MESHLNGIAIDVGFISQCQGILNDRDKDMKTFTPKKMKHSPYQAHPKIYGAAKKNSMPPDDPPLMNEEQNKLVQQIIGGVLYYSRAVDLTFLPALSSIESEQASTTENTEKNAHNYWII